MGLEAEPFFSPVGIFVIPFSIPSLRMESVKGVNSETAPPTPQLSIPPHQEASPDVNQLTLCRGRASQNVPDWICGGMSPYRTVRQGNKMRLRTNTGRQDSLKTGLG